MTVKNSQVAHLWANRSRQSASGSNFYFDGDRIYSYGPHFCVGRLIDHPRAGLVALLNSRTYSRSTQRHQSLARNAVSHRCVLTVPNLDVSPDNPRHIGHAENREYFKARIARKVAELSRARTGADWRRNDIQLTVRSANEYAERFRQSWRLRMPKLDPATLARLRVEDAALAKRRREALARHEERAAEHLAERVEKWRAGGSGVYFENPTALRIAGNSVETSRGALVPIPDAVRAIRFIASRRATGQPWRRNGERFPVGAFELDAVDAEGNITAGCHAIEWAEIARLAPALRLQV